jgi:hypothetical protein
MTTDDARLDERRIAELRRLAFGRTTTAQDEARAAAARHELERLLTPPVVEVTPPPVQPEASEVEPEAAAPALARARRFWIPATAALVVGVLLGAGAMIALGRGISIPVAAPTDTFTPGSSTLPPDTDPLRASLDLGSGNLEAADVWFRGPQDKQDEFPDEMTLEGLTVDPASTRLAASSGARSVWIGRTLDGNLCLMVATGAQSAGGACADRQTFALNGLDMLQDSSFLVVWNGERMTTSTTVR